jgi:hypothetical protein
VKIRPGGMPYLGPDQESNRSVTTRASANQ